MNTKLYMKNKWFVDLLCFYPENYIAEWYIEKNNIDVSDYIPDMLRESDMGTYGEYCENIVRNNKEEFYYYKDGLKSYKWIEKNNYWLNKICDTKEDKKILYKLINEKDFRY